MLKKQLLLGLLTLMSIVAKSQTLPAYVVPNLDWIKYHSYRDQIGSAPNALDINSNVYLTGYDGLTSAADILLLKYDSLGVLQYTVSYDNGGYDNSHAIKVNLLGEAMIAGSSYDSGTNIDGFLMKVDASGSILWTARLDAGLNDIDEFYDIAFDTNGDIYATGKTKVGSTYCFYTVKVDGSNGSLIWQQTIDIFNTGQGCESIALTLSPNGNYLYVTGKANNNAGNDDIIVTAFTTNNGNPYWLSHTVIDGTANLNDKASAIISVGSDIAICGEVNNSSTGLDYSILNIDGSNGNINWQRVYDFGSANNRATGIAKDSSLNIGVIGTALNGSTYEYHTVIYDIAGNQLALNKENTGLSTLNVEPRLCNDSVAHHWYGMGEKMRNSKDIFVYQITPSGNTSWRKFVDGQNSDVDAATSIGVNGIGVVYVGAMSKNSGNNYDFTTIKINQTPVYFPPDIIANEKPSVKHVYYPNRGQILKQGTTELASDILFQTMNEYPLSYYKANTFSYKFFRRDAVNSGMDTIQRIDISMLGSNSLAEAHPYVQKHGGVTIMDKGLPNNLVETEGYERYFIPNVYPSIDLHYFSNENGLKMYYVVKPFASPTAIRWLVSGATTSTVNGQNLEIKGFNGKVIFDKPQVYTVNMSGQAIPLGTITASWAGAGGVYNIPLSGAYTPSTPVIIELDYSNAISNPTGIGNFLFSTYMGGSLEDGLRSINVKKSTGDYAVVGTNNSYVAGREFPNAVGSAWTSTVSSTSGGGYLTVALFRPDGQMDATNVFGIPAFQMAPVEAVYNGDRVTVIGNCPATNTQFPYMNPANFSVGSYTNSNGPGYVMQFEREIFSGIPKLNKVKWFTRVNGHVSGLAMKPNTKELYVTSNLNTTSYTPDTYSLTGAMNQTTLPNTDWHGQISKFDSVGVRKWSTLFTAGNTAINSAFNNEFVSAPGISFIEPNTKFKIGCDNYGFALTGEINTNQLNNANKYGAIVTTTYTGGKDAFVSRFNNKDSVVFTTFVGGTSDEVFNKVKITQPNEIMAVGYSSSQQYQKLVKYNVGQFIDSVVVSGTSKILINKFDTLGNRTWGTLFGGNTTAKSTAWSLTVDNLGKTYVTGRTNNNINMQNINSGSSYSKLNHIKAIDSYMLAFTPTNTLLWNTYYGGEYDECATELDFNPVGDRIMGTGFTQTQGKITTGIQWFPVFGTSLYPTAWKTDAINSSNSGSSFTYGPFDGYVGWFTTAIPVGIEEYFNKKDQVSLFDVFPNPANDVFFVTLSRAYTKNVKVSVYNMLGQEMYSQLITNVHDNTVVQLYSSNLPNGSYVVKVSDAEKAYSKKIIITGH